MLLSIIIPVYNAENFIERCIESIIEQSKLLDTIELVIINDGSTDQSKQILEKLENQYNVISLYEQQNSGEGFTRNIGLEKAKGKYIWFIDADDYIDGTILKNICKVLTEKAPEVILFGYKTVNLEGVKVSEVKFNDAMLSTASLIKNSQYTNTVWSKVIDASIIKDNQIRFNPEVRTATDFDFSFRVLYFSQNVSTLKDVNYNYVVNPDSISNIRTVEHLERLAKDSVTVGREINSFLIKNEVAYKGREIIFRAWLDNYLYGLLFSLFRFNYQIKFISHVIDELKTTDNYPVNSSEMSIKKKLFLLIANNKTIFLFACRIKRILKKNF